MDDELTTNATLPSSPANRQMDRRARTSSVLRLMTFLCVIWLTGSLTGCSLFVMAGKLIYGDPKVSSPFTRGTGFDLAEDEMTVLIIFSTPDSTKSKFPSIEFDLTEETIRRLKRREIQVVDSDDVAGWFDDNGGYWDNDDLPELAGHFNADIIIHIDLDSFTIKEENSPGLLRGQADGNVYGYLVREVAGKKVIREIFVREFSSTHPRNQPVSVDQVSPRAFQKRYTDIVATKIAQMLHDHRVSELIE